MNNNNIFNSGLSSSNPFSLNNSGLQNTENSLMETYAKLEALKARQNQINTAFQAQQNTQQQPQQRLTVFTDIANEFNNLSEDEINFIVLSKEYESVNSKYQNEFSQFLINKFSNEYLQTGNTRTLEEMLSVIRKKKEQYKQKFADDINEIREQNKTLLDKNNELAENNERLQEQLKTIQNQLWKD